MHVGMNRAPATLTAHLEVADPVPPKSGVLILHPDDCQSAWRFLELLARPAVRARLPLVAIRTTAHSSDEQWVQRLPTALRTVDRRPLTRSASIALAPLGIAGIPTLLVFDGSNLVAVERVPPDPMAFVQLGRRLDPRLAGLTESAGPI